MEEIKCAQNGYDMFYVCSISDTNVDTYINVWNSVFELCKKDCIFISAQVFLSVEVKEKDSLLDIIDSEKNCSVLFVDGKYGGVIIHAVSKSAEPILKKTDDNIIELTYDGTTSIHIFGLCNLDIEIEKNYYNVFKKLALLLNDTNFKLARTWCWLKNILMHYEVFNKKRTAQYQELDFFNNKCLPASTGVGVSKNMVNPFLLDAVLYDAKTPIIYHYKTEKQNSAFDYGSAFARMTEVQCRNKRILYISGTAAILKDGESYKSLDVQEQYNNVLENVSAALNEANMDWSNMIYGIVYCKNDEIVNAIKNNELFSKYNVIPITATICRDDLLLEMELYASAAN